MNIVDKIALALGEHDYAGLEGKGWFKVYVKNGGKEEFEAYKRTAQVAIEAYKQSDEYKGQEWQDISTAPKDGTLFLAYRPAAKKHKIVSAWNKKVSFLGEEHYFINDHNGNSINASHWMPLPEPLEVENDPKA